MARDPSKQIPIIIEFAGYSGTGKSFISMNLAAALGGDCRMSSEIPVNVKDVFVFAIRNPRTLWNIVRFVNDSQPKQWAGYYRMFRKVFDYRIRVAKASNIGSKYVVFSEGMLHRFRMIRSLSGRKEYLYGDIDPVFRHRLFSSADIVVMVTSTLETLAARRVLRSDPQSQHEKVEKEACRIRHRLDKSIQNTELDISFAKREHGFQFLKLKNEPNIAVDENIERILRLLRSIDVGISQ